MQCEHWLLRSFAEKVEIMLKMQVELEQLTFAESKKINTEGKKLKQQKCEEKAEQSLNVAKWAE